MVRHAQVLDEVPRLLHIVACRARPASRPLICGVEVGAVEVGQAIACVDVGLHGAACMPYVQELPDIAPLAHLPAVERAEGSLRMFCSNLEENADAAAASFQPEDETRRLLATAVKGRSHAPSATPAVEQRRPRVLEFEIRIPHQRTVSENKDAHCPSVVSNYSALEGQTFKNCD